MEHGGIFPVFLIGKYSLLDIAHGSQSTLRSFSGANVQILFFRNFYVYTEAVSVSPASLTVASWLGDHFSIGRYIR